MHRCSYGRCAKYCKRIPLHYIAHTNLVHIGEANTGHVPQMRTWPFPMSWVDAPNHPSPELVDLLFYAV